MPRPKVNEKLRKRISKACFYCQKTKQKCDGLTPCEKCATHNRSSSCAYSPTARSYGRHRNRQKRRDRCDEPGSAGNIELNASAALSDCLGNYESSARVGTADHAASEQEVAVPGLSQVLYDNKGQIVYLGNCAALAFLQNIQELIESETGHIADISSFSVVEELPPLQDCSLTPYVAQNKDGLKDLIDVFFISTCGIIDLFSKPHINYLLDHWINEPNSISKGSSAVLYLVVACAAQIRSASLVDKVRAQSFYYHGRQIALLELTNNPTTETIQAFALISIYMLGCSWRNGASLNLGIAISAAKSLGYHQDYTNSVYDKDERRRRAQIWKTLHYHDLFFSAMMGRSSSTSDSASNATGEESLTSGAENEEYYWGISMTESLRAFLTIELTVNQVYTKREVSLGTLQALTREIQEKSLSLPKSLCDSAKIRSHNGLIPAQQWNLRNTHIACSYYFVMMLVTRPFLITALRAKSSLRDSNGPRVRNPDYWFGVNISSEIAYGAMACIDTATYTIELLHELLMADMLFKNMPFIVAWTFVSALVLNSAYFGQLDSRKSIAKTLRQAEDVLAFFTIHSPQARRYQLILKKLSRAAEDHIINADQHTLQCRAASVPRLFQLNSGRLGESLNTAKSFAASTIPSEAAGNPESTSYLPFHDERTSKVISTIDCSESTRSDGIYGQHSLLHDLMFNPNDAVGVGDDVLEPAELTGREACFQFDENSSIWDFTWAGSL